MASWIKSDGTIDVVQPKNGKTFKLDELQGFVGGYIEIIHPALPGYEGQMLVINEEGKIHGLPLNQRATELYAFEAPTAEQLAAIEAMGVVMIGFGPHDDDYGAGNVHGDVLLCDDNEVE